MLLFKSFLVILLALPAVFFADTNASAPPFGNEDKGNLSPMFTQARSAALAWITLVDQVAYPATWDEAGSLLKDTVTREQWVAALDVLRRPLGYASTRKIGKWRVLRRLKYGTEGYFIEIDYNTSFWAKASAQEKCILMYGYDRRWQVISYSIN